jgi:hypothetical protein
MITGRLKLQGLQPAVKAAAEWALSLADYYGCPVAVTSGYRSWADQEKLYTNYVQCLQTGAMGLTADCKYPANKPGDSSHNYGLSWDSSVPADWLPFWNYVRQLAGFKTYPNDPVHAEVPDWRQYVTWPSS